MTTTTKSKTKSTAKSGTRKTTAKTGAAKTGAAKAAPKPKTAASKPAAVKPAVPAPKAAAPEAVAATPLRAPVTTAANSAATPPAGDAAPTPIVSTAEATVTGPKLRKRELIEAVVRRTGIKKKDARPVIEATLDIIGDALHDAREINLQPMGNMRVHKARSLRKGQVLTTKIRQPKRGGLPDAAE